MHTMLIRPTKEELASFAEPDVVIYNGGAFPANRLTTDMQSTTSIDLNLEGRELVILGTEYAGEMKKGVFTRRELLRSQTGRALDALFGGRQNRRPVACRRRRGAPRIRRY